MSYAVLTRLSNIWADAFSKDINYLTGFLTVAVLACMNRNSNIIFHLPYQNKTYNLSFKGSHLNMAKQKYN